ncbi:MAG: methylmalonyl-CoA mutase family protein, partial [Jhaorihella sp.]
FDGSHVIEARTAALREAAQAELDDVLAHGGAFQAVDVLKSRLVASMAARTRRIEAGEQTVVGVNAFTETAESPLGGSGAILTVDPAVEQDQIARLTDWRANRDEGAAEAALTTLRADARAGRNVMPASIACAKAGVTTGEWAGVMRQVHGEYRGPTGVSASPSNRTEGLDEIRTAVDAVSTRLGRRLKFLVGKPGRDGHSTGAEQIAARARDCGMDITYEGLRLTPEQIVDAALDQNAHVVGLSILSGSHLPLIEELMERMRSADLSHIPVVVGGIIPDEDAVRLTRMGVARVYTPKDFELNRIMFDIVALAEPKAEAAE